MGTHETQEHCQATCQPKQLNQKQPPRKIVPYLNAAGEIYLGEERCWRITSPGKPDCSNPGPSSMPTNDETNAADKIHLGAVWGTSGNNSKWAKLFQARPTIQTLKKHPIWTVLHPIWTVFLTIIIDVAWDVYNEVFLMYAPTKFILGRCGWLIRRTANASKLVRKNGDTNGPAGLISSGRGYDNIKFNPSSRTCMWSRATWVRNGELDQSNRSVNWSIHQHDDRTHRWNASGSEANHKSSRIESHWINGTNRSEKSLNVKNQSHKMNPRSHDQIITSPRADRYQPRARAALRADQRTIDLGDESKNDGQSMA